MSAAAAVCEIPAASRAARTSPGDGLAEGPFGPRFGWLGIAASGPLRPGGAPAEFVGRDKAVLGDALP